MWPAYLKCRELVYRAGKKTKTTHSPSFTFCSFNILMERFEATTHPGYPKWSERSMYVNEILKETDVCGLTEVMKSQIEALKSSGKQLIYKPKIGGHGDGSAILYNSNFEKQGELKRDLTLRPQVLLAAHLRHTSTGNNIIVAVLHLKSGSKKEGWEPHRIKQLKEALYYIQEWNTWKYPVILCGDFNSNRFTNSDEYDDCYKTMVNFTDVFAGDKTPTHDSEILDYVFVSGALQVNSRIVRNSGVASDHNALIVEFSFPSSSTHVLRNIRDIPSYIAKYDGTKLIMNIPTAPSHVQDLMESVAHFIQLDNPTSHPKHTFNSAISDDHTDDPTDMQTVFVPCRSFKRNDVQYLILFAWVISDECVYGCIQKSNKQTKFRLLSYAPPEYYFKTNVQGASVMGFHPFLKYVETSKLYETYPILNTFREGKLLSTFKEAKYFKSFMELSYSDVFESIDQSD